MSNERDELAKVLQAAAKSPCPIRFAHVDGEPTGYGELFAEAVLAAGYRKPRTVSTDEELDALPVGSVVDGGTGFIYEKFAWEDDPEFPWWFTTGDKRHYSSKQISLPATVLYEAPND
jgi:hypothetical protein